MGPILKIFSVLFILLLGSMTFWVWQLSQTINNKINGNRFLPPTEFYSAPIKLEEGSLISLPHIEKLFRQAQFRKRDPLSPLHPGDYAFWSKDQCQKKTQLSIPESTNVCLIFRLFKTSPNQTQLVLLGQNNEVLSTHQGPPFEKSLFSQTPPVLFAQYLGGSPTYRQVVSLGQVPTHCKNAVVAIEDHGFLEHSGINLTAIARAFWSLIKNRRITQGGSTITQQLVKVYFLNSQRTFRRKIKEAVMALILENQVSKDEILELYINSIYMGQQGLFQIRGFAAASQYYFGNSISGLNLQQCAMLAATLNSPGRFDPFKNPDQTTKRRNYIIERMAQSKMISSEQKKQAQLASLPPNPQTILQESAPYYVNSVREELKKLGISNKNGLRVYTSINLKAQKAARQAVTRQLKHLEKKHPQLKSHSSPLQASLVSVDIKTGQIQALIGGRNYKTSHFNRVLEAKRQVGSLIKPFVYLAALETVDENGDPFTPLSEVDDTPFTHKYEGQTWTPQNYKKKYYGTVPFYFALKNSLNVSTAKVGLKIGLDAIIDVVRRLGIEAPLKPVPSLTLGAFEISAWDLVKAYTAIARMGEGINLSLVERVESLDGELLYQVERKKMQMVAPEAVASLIGMLKQTLKTGTAKAIPKWYGFKALAAGKTGTTSDNRDAWFIGFTPDNLALVWVGFDDNHSHELTGASGAIPIWADYMRNTLSHKEDRDFHWPENTQRRFYPKEELEKWNLPELQWPEFKGVELITI